MPASKQEDTCVWCDRPLAHYGDIQCPTVQDATCREVSGPALHDPTDAVATVIAVVVILALIVWVA